VASGCTPSDDLIMVEANWREKLDGAFRVSRTNAIKWTSASDDRSRTAVAVSKGVGWLDR